LDLLQFERNGKEHIMPSLFKILTRCKIYDLEQERFYGMPTYPSHKPGYFYTLYRQHRSTYNPKEYGQRSSASGMIVTMEHAGTHIDALCHQAYDMKLHGNLLVNNEIETPFGFNKLSIEKIPPIITRGILLDVAGLKGLDYLPENYEITKQDFENCLEFEKIDVEKGDVVLVRTGYGKFWINEDKYMKAAGVSLEASRWLAKKLVFAVGIDNCAWDLPSARDQESGSNLPSHVHLIVENGIHIMEHLNIEHLAEDQQFLFLFICLPLKLKGATGSPIRPIAIAVN
jgi:kynurenine formamidase